MISYKDRTFCTSISCTTVGCALRLTDEVEKAAAEIKIAIAMGDRSMTCLTFTRREDAEEPTNLEQWKDSYNKGYYSDD